MQVNIIPVIAKADTVSKSELDKLKIKIMSELVSNGVQIYQFPTEDEAVAEINSSMNVSPRNTQHNTLCILQESMHFARSFWRIISLRLYSCEVFSYFLVFSTNKIFILQTHLPFAVVGSVEDVKVGNKMVKARIYPWGSVQGEYAELIWQASSVQSEACC